MINNGAGQFPALQLFVTCDTNQLITWAALPLCCMARMSYNDVRYCLRI